VIPISVNLEKSNWISCLTSISELLRFTAKNSIKTFTTFREFSNALVFELYFPDHIERKRNRHPEICRAGFKEVLGEDDFEQLPDETKRKCN